MFFKSFPSSLPLQKKLPFKWRVYLCYHRRPVSVYLSFEGSRLWLSPWHALRYFLRLLSVIYVFWTLCCAEIGLKGAQEDSVYTCLTWFYTSCRYGRMASKWPLAICSSDVHFKHGTKLFFQLQRGKVWAVEAPMGDVLEIYKTMYFLVLGWKYIKLYIAYFGNQGMGMELGRLEYKGLKKQDFQPH